MNPLSTLPKTTPGRPVISQTNLPVGDPSSMALGQNVGLFLLLAFLFCLFGRITDFFLSNLHIPLALSLLCLLFVPFSPGFTSVFTNKIGVAILLFTIWMLACLPTSYWRGGSWEVITEEWFKSFACFIIVAVLPSRVSACARVLRVMGLCFVVAAGLAITRGTLVDGRLALPVGMYSGPNELAAAMVLGILYLLYAVTDRRLSVIRRALSMLAVPALFWVLAQTGSRGSMICLAVLILMLILSQRLITRITLLIAAGVALVLSLFIMPDTIKLRYSVFFGQTVDDVATDQQADRVMEASGSANQRFLLLKKSVLLTLQNPIFGVGPGNFASKENEESRLQGRPKGFWLGTHNTYGQISSEMGIPGILLFLFCLYGCWSEIRKIETRYRNGQGAWERSTLHTAYFIRLTLIYYLVLFLFEHVAYAPFWPFLAAMVAAFARNTATEGRTVAAAPPSPAIPNGRMQGKTLAPPFAIPRTRSPRL